MGLILGILIGLVTGIVLGAAISFPIGSALGILIDSSVSSFAIGMEILLIGLCGFVIYRFFHVRVR
ncbi:hypothetical protein M3182_12780 [Mesobacillus maritimus]|uniref:hypothetical protein n=1 Tax=Mesobacillus maritimus TaxID=1643336 RepID=UPI00203CE148|nr:hypothetical protein [Mesobacillus maritimus]MCM3586607.1 hypothetical protein [Mesobacillus maritimus]MCM3668639.1 hypothetical protein [Mesobacillus maritimus]